MKLNLGAADRRISDCVSVDRVMPADLITDLTADWPFQTSTIDEVFALDIFEHLPDRIHTMNELHRVLKCGAHARIEVPSAVRGAGFAQDPTHQSAWCRNSFQYFEYGAYARQRLGRSYGITAEFRILELSEREYPDAFEPVVKITAVLAAVK